MPIITQTRESVGHVRGDIEKWMGIAQRGEGTNTPRRTLSPPRPPQALCPDLISPPHLWFSCRPSDWNSLPQPSAPHWTLQLGVLPRALTHRLVLVLQATGGHIRHSCGCSGVLELCDLSPHATNCHGSRLSPGWNDAEKKHGSEEETGSLPLPGRLPEEQVGLISGEVGGAGAFRSPNPALLRFWVQPTPGT